MGENFVQRHVNVLDFPHVRAALLFANSTVFLVCFFGNLAVLVVITFHKRMRNAKNFILGHLDIANLCVALFSIYQSLAMFLVKRWTLGPFMCKMFHFIISLSHAASVLILVLTAVERYVVIIHPIQNRLLLTMRRKRLAIFIAWMLSALLSFHKFYYATVIQHHVGPSQVELICAINISTFNHRTADMLSLISLFVLPLAVICLLYTRIAIFLRNRQTLYSFLIQFDIPSCNKKNNSNGGTIQQPSNRWYTKRHSHHLLCAMGASPSVLASSLRARNKANRRVVKMLTIAAVSFAFCNLPFHLRKILQNYSDSYNNIANPWMELVAPLTFPVQYANCAVSPFVHALLSKDFQRSLAEVVRRCRKIYQGPSAVEV